MLEARSGGGMLRLGFVLIIVVSIWVSPVRCAVSSIDLGAEWLKVAVVNPKPGQIPISVAINEMSKRKSPALVAFQSGNRLIGEEAAGIVARYPDKVYSHVRDMIGKPYGFVKDLIDSLYLHYDIVEDYRGAVGIKIDDGVTIFSVEELAAMILGYALNLAQFHSKVPIKDAVITVPPYFGQAERKGLLQAAQLAGVNVLSLLNEYSGAALQYGIDKDFSNESRHVIFYDMGARSTYAALVYFSSYKTKEFGKTVSANQFQVKDVRWNSELGGQHMESRLVEYFADEFNKQLGSGVDVRKSTKAMAKLKKQVKRTKEILSANTVAPLSVESLYDDRDFRSTITREKFEELCKDLWEKSLAPIEEVLEHSGLKMSDIYAVELIGGATRVPKLQFMLQEFLGKSSLDKHLDADEAIVLGASLHAANLSDGIKLNRKLGMVDGSTYGYVVQLEAPGLLSNDNSRQILAPRLKKLPSKMFRSIVYDKDFEVSLAYESEDLLPPGTTSPIFALYAVSGLADATEKYSSRNLSSPIKANMHFSLSRSGILSLDRADAVIEVTEWVDVPKANTTLDNSTSASSNKPIENGPHTPEGTDNGEQANTNTGDSSQKENKIEDAAVEKKLKKRIFRVPLKITETTKGPGMPLSKESFVEAKRKLEQLDKKDADRRRTAELKNNLEAYIYATREKLETSELESVSTNEERQFFAKKLEEVQEWLYMDGEDANATDFQQRLEMLKSIGDPLFFRLSEVSARPAASEHARKFFNELDQIVQGWESKKSWLPLHRIEQVTNDAKNVKAWLDEKEAAQKKASLFSKPEFTSEEVYQKILDLQDKVASVNKIPKPKPKVESPKANDTESDSQKAENKDSTSEEKPSDDQLTKDSTGSSTDESSYESEIHDEL
uniref:Heat shock 70 kDa protein 17 n=1 Tax=Kalanchoe fedtschenkoi TaxID=63787 RepID=A0A7N0UGC3_KALFE